jgi:hypothetical protein
MVSVAFARLGHVWRQLFGVAALALVPAGTATAVVDVLGAGPPAAIVNGTLTTASGSTWTSALISVSLVGWQFHLGVPVLVVLGMFLAIAAGLRIVGGDGLPAASRWVWRRLSSLLALAVVLAVTAVTAVIVLTLVAVQTGELAPLVLIGGGVVCWYTWVRLLLALPLLACVDTSGSPTGAMATRGAADALRRAWISSRGKTLELGTALLVYGVIVPGLVGYVLNAVPPIAEHLYSSPTVDVIWVAVAAVITDLALFTAAALYAALLWAALPSPNGEPDLDVRNEDEAVRPHRPRRSRVLAMAALVVAAAIPALTSAIVVIANPRGLPVATIGRPSFAVFGTPLAFTVLTDGTTVMVDNMQVAWCRDAHCSRAQTVGMPCDGGAEPTEISPGVHSCAGVGPYVAADVTPDGTLLALVRGHHLDGAQLIRCSVLNPTPGYGACAWIGATDLGAERLLIGGPMAVAATPSGGFVAAMLGSGPDDAHNEIVLFSCSQLGCPQPTVQPIATIPATSTDGVLRLAADRNGMTLGYLDRQTPTLWLGHCTGSCNGGLALTHAGSWPHQPNFGVADLQVVTTPRGPRALVTTPSGTTGSGDVWTASVRCTDPTCTQADGTSCDCWGPTRLAVDDIGQTYEIATDNDRGTPWIANETNRSPMTLPDKGTVLAATFGPDERLRLLLAGVGGASLVTCAERDCQPPCPPDSCVLPA